MINNQQTNVMAINLSDISPEPGSRHCRKRVGRGNASGHGTYSGRGQKGQRSRSGGKKGLKVRGLKSILKRIPKLKGFKSLFSKMAIVNLGALEKKFKEGKVIDPIALIKIGLIRTDRYGVKILGRGKITKKFIVKASAFSRKAEEAIKKAGGKTMKI